MPEPSDETPEPEHLTLAFDLLVETELPPGFDPGAVGSLARCVLAAEGAAGAWQVAVALVDDDRLRALHRDFMGIDEATDVMTFPLGDAPGGDIAVSVERAAEQGPHHGLTAADEVLFLVAHGLLHLCGWDDPTDRDRVAMLARQGELLAVCRERG